MMKYWFGTINMNVWTMKNSFSIIKISENHSNQTKMQFSENYFSFFLKIGRKSISTGSPGRSRPPEFKKNSENRPK